MKPTIIVAALLLFLAACEPDPVQQDLLTYVNDGITQISALESEAIEAYASVSGPNYDSDSVMYAVIQTTVIPKYEEFYSKLKAIQPSTAEVKKMHEEYITAAADQLEAFRLILEAIEKQDAAIIERANEDLDKARAMLNQWRKDLDEECKEHGVTIE